MILGAELHGRDVAHPQPAPHDDGPNVLRGVRFLIGDDQVLTVILRHPSHGLHGDGPPDRVGQVRVGHSLGGKPGGIGDHLQLAHVRALHVHAPDTGNS